MLDLFYQGGLLFMSLLTISFIAGIAIIVRSIMKKQVDEITVVSRIGLFALVLGVFGQLIGLYSAFSTLQEVGSVSPQMLYGGLRVSMIPTLYGALIFLILQGSSIAVAKSSLAK
ncbi:MAG: MotA/TolQ/ExbB proton channel family protein [Flavobacteriaceae bacterium]